MPARAVKTTRFLALVMTAMLVVAGCSPSGQSPLDQATQALQEIEQSQMSAKAFADMEASPARGEKTCHVRQYSSAYLYRRQRASEHGTGAYSALAPSSEIFARVYPNGSVGIAVTPDTYPGTDAYFLIGGRRYRGPGDEYIPLDRNAVVALRADSVVQFSWTDWPYRTEINRQDVLAGFAAAYDECVRFLNT